MNPKVDFYFDKANQPVRTGLFRPLVLAMLGHTISSTSKRP